MTIMLFGIEDIIIGITHWHSLVLFAFDIRRYLRSLSLTLSAASQSSVSKSDRE